ncbi:hypothetical protein EYF80_041749 [Liparis tanakae]|uniref:Uncharacterized protein n=1 Tax=Liparis tanakae TaxID=230148 RepID=A0A4Z2G5J0_9TELE|nr:hypothetical protein EYF80_041749 [Liparis tanakae]
METVFSSHQLAFLSFLLKFRFGLQPLRIAASGGRGLVPLLAMLVPFTMPPPEIGKGTTASGVDVGETPGVTGLKEEKIASQKAQWSRHAESNQLAATSSEAAENGALCVSDTVVFIILTELLMVISTLRSSEPSRAWATWAAECRAVAWPCRKSQVHGRCMTSGREKPVISQKPSLQ